MSPVILARKINKVRDTSGAAQAFQVGPLQVYPSVDNAFQGKDRVFVFFQVYGLAPSLREEALVECTVLVGGAAVLKSPRRRVADFAGGRDILEELDPASLIPGTYTVKAAVLDGNGRELLSGETPFLVAATPVPGAWVAAQSAPPPDDAQALYILGTQFLNTGDIERAGEKLREAHAKKPKALEYAVGYARVLLLTKEPAKAKEVLASLAGSSAAGFDFYQCLGRAAQALGDYQAAVGHYQKALSLKGNAVEVLNSLGECFLNLGDREQAIRVWRKSLEIDPGQERIRNLIEERKNPGPGAFSG